MKNTLRRRRKSCRKTPSCKITQEKVTLEVTKKEKMTPYDKPQVLSDNYSKGVKC